MLHESPAAKIIEVVPDSDTLGQALTNAALSQNGWPRGVVPSSHVHYAVVEPNQCTERNAGQPGHDKQFHGTSFALGTVMKPLPESVSPADLLIVSQSILRYRDFFEIAERFSRLVRPDGTVLLVDNERSDGEKPLERAGFQVFLRIPAGDFTVKMLRAPHSQPIQDHHSREFIILEPAASEGTRRFSKALHSILTEQGHVASSKFWTETTAVKDFNGKAIVSLLELERPLLDRLSEQDFQSLRNLVLQSERILWITCGNSPFMHIIDGFARCISSEMAGSTFQILNLSSETGTEYGPSLAARICLRDTKDKEFREVDGTLYINRIFKNMDGNDRLASCLEDSTRVAPLRDQTRPLRLTVGKPGLLDTLHFIENERLRSALADEDVEIKVKAAGLK